MPWEDQQDWEKLQSQDVVWDSEVCTCFSHWGRSILYVRDDSQAGEVSGAFDILRKLERQKNEFRSPEEKGPWGTPRRLVEWAKLSTVLTGINGSRVRLTQSLGELKGLPGGSDGKESACSVGDPGSIPREGKIPLKRKWQPTPVILSGKPHGQRSLVSYSPWGRKKSDTTEQLLFLSRWMKEIWKS